MVTKTPMFFSDDPNSIVTVNVQTVEAPTPNNYQQSGCFLSFGSTNLAEQTVQELTQLADLDQIILNPTTVTSASWATGHATINVTTPTFPTSWANGDTISVVLKGFTPAAYNGTFTATIVDNNTFTIPIVSDPGSVTVFGTFQSVGSIELSQMVTTYFSQGNRVSIWVLELGNGVDVAANVADLQTWLTNNSRSFYGYVFNRRFGATESNITALKVIFDQYQNPEAMTYFWLTVTSSTMNILDATNKCVVQFVEAPSVTQSPNVNATDGEFSIAAMFYNAISFNASSINPVAPMAFKYLFGVTPYPTRNNGPLLTQFKEAFTNYVSSGAEGGISFNIVYQGVTKDGYDYFNWWWTIDWVQINVNLNLSNAIINGSNNSVSPLYYDQDGINYLLSVLVATMVSASSFGMVVGDVISTSFTQDVLRTSVSNGRFAGSCDCNAIPFGPYSAMNPGHYKIGEYDGLSTLFIPKRGFIHIMVNVVASSLVTV